MSLVEQKDDPSENSQPIEISAVVKMYEYIYVSTKEDGGYNDGPLGSQGYESMQAGIGVSQANVQPDLSETYTQKLVVATEQLDACAWQAESVME